MPVAPNDKSFIFGGIFMLANRIQTLGDRGISGDITTKQWFQMLVLRDLPAGSSINDIAEDGGTTRQNTKKLLAQLEKKGYVRLAPNPRDKRSTAVYMTEGGLEYMRQTSERGGAFVERMLRGVSDAEVQAGKALIQKLLENLEQMKKEIP